jgi:hypothetical protein
MLEHDFQKSFIEYLNYNKIVRVNEFDRRRHKGWVFAVINNEHADFKKHPIFRGIAKKNSLLGRCNGVSDLIVFYKKLYFIELKVASNKQSNAQKIFQLAVEFCNFEYKIVRSFDDFKIDR